MENPKGVQAQSPGLRGTSYPGNDHARVSTLKWVAPPAGVQNDPTPLGLTIFHGCTQDSSFLATPGLEAAIPLGLKTVRLVCVSACRRGVSRQILSMLVTDFIPATKPESKHLLIMLHGLGDSIEGYRWLPEALNLPWLNYLLVNAPDSYYGGFSWYDFAGNIVPGVSRSRSLLFKLVEKQETAGFAPSQTFLGGFSQGSLMSLEVGLRYPKVLAGIVGISGYVCEPEKLILELSPVAKKQRVLVTHGSQDPIIPLAPVRAQIQMLKNAGLNIEWHEFAKAHTIAGEAEIQVIRKFLQGPEGAS
jgi:phospholipase/carboxylesterase